MNLLKPSFNTFFKSKHLIINIVSISLIFGVIISIFYSMVLLNDLLEDRIKNNIINRVIHISSDYFLESDIEKLNNLENIEAAYRTVQIGRNVILDKNYTFTLGYCMKEEIKDISKGNLFDNTSNYQIIIPNYVYDSTGEKVDISKYLEKEVEIAVNDINVLAKVVGIQDNNSTFIYINENLKNYLVSVDDKIEAKGYICAIVDDYRNVDIVIDKLKAEFEYGANLSDTRGQSDIKLYNMASFLVILVLILAVGFNYISASMIVSRIISDEAMDIAIFKAIGYRVKDICKIITYRIFAIIGISSIFSLFIALIVNKVISFVLKYKLDIILKDNYCIFLGSFLVFVFLIFALSLLCIKINKRKIKKINTIELLKED